MCPPRFYTMIRRSKPQERKLFRLELVRYATEHGVKPAACTFCTTPATVRKWMARYDGTLASLQDHSRAPHHCPHRIPLALEHKIVSLRKQLPTFSAARLVKLFNLPCSAKTVARVIRQHGLTRPRRTIRRKNNDLRAVKAMLPLFARVHIDTKMLTDIPELLPWLHASNLPRYQYTFRETVSGLQFIAYSQELAGVYAELFAQRIIEHLRRCGVVITQMTIQTDNGSEFIGSWNSREPSGFTKSVEAAGAKHFAIPPGAHRWQADVETVHNLVETELYCIERFWDREDFLCKATTYQMFFNTVRPNASKANRTPWEIIQQRWPRKADPRIVLLPPVFLENILQSRLGSPARLPNSKPPPGGYHVPTHPSLHLTHPQF